MATSDAPEENYAEEEKPSPPSPVPASHHEQQTMVGLSASVARHLGTTAPPAGFEGKYIIKSEIARGGMGVILRAGDRDIRREVAMKVMQGRGDEKDRARFVEEAQVTGQLEHPNIVPIHELGADANGQLYFTMKLVKGRSLAELLQSHREGDALALRDFPLGRLLSLFTNVCNAVAFAHAKGVVHRDLKPANIMVGDYGEVLLMDWGLAKPGRAAVVEGTAAQTETDADWAAERDQRMAEAVRSLRQDTGSHLTVDGTIVGTPHYMPPEQAFGEIARIDARSDIYSLGAILYEILALVPPCEGASVWALLKNAGEGNIRPPDERAPDRNIPRELSAVVMKALALRKEDRYQSADDLRRDVDRFLEGRSVSAKADTFWEALIKLIRRNRGVSIASAVAVIVVVIVVGIAFQINLQARRDAESSERSAVQAQGDAERALQEARTEANLRQQRQKEAVPLLVEKAWRQIEQGQLDDAARNLELATDFDPGNPAPSMLLAEVLSAQGKHSQTLTRLDQVLTLTPADADARRLRDLCREGISPAERSVALADFFTQRKEYALADTQFRSARERLIGYRARVDAAWPGSGARLTMDQNGRCSFTLANVPELQQMVRDLKPLQGISFDLLNLNGCSNLKDLTPLTGSRIRTLLLSDTGVIQVGALTGMPLTTLDLQNTPVSDLQPLAGSSLSNLDLGNTRVADLSPLRGMPLERLNLHRCDLVADLSSLEAAPLTWLNLQNCTRLADITPLHGRPLTWLSLAGCTQVEDLTPLDGMPLEWLSLAACARVKDLGPLRRLPLTYLDLRGCAQVADLTALQGLPLTRLDLFGCAQVRDLSPLRGMALNALGLQGCTGIRDLSPLIGMPLTELHLCGCTEVTDARPVAALPLRKLALTPSAIQQGMDKIRKMPGLELLSTNGVTWQKAAVFWKGLEAPSSR